MIDPKELRIGNLVSIMQENNGQIVELHSRTSNINILPTKIYSYFPYESLEPIPLTKEWLERLGFEELWIGRWKHLEGNVDIEKYNDAGYHLLCEERTNWSKCYNYVHQIQTLFWILTGKELTIKEPINNQQ